jgi:hypothetical protein
MSLFDPTFIRFDGSPDTGRVPTTVTVTGGQALSRVQQFGVDQAYSLFRTARRTSITPFHAEGFILPDGTKVHIWSLQNRDEVLVEPAPSGDKDRLPHGFAVVTNWRTTLIYRRDLNGDDPSTDSDNELRWLLGPLAPQVRKLSATVFDNQVFRKDIDANEYFNLPHVHGYSDRSLWDYKRRGAPEVDNAPAVPFLLEYGGEFRFGLPHYLVRNTVVNASGTLRYTMEDQPPILVPEHPNYPESVHYQPPNTDAKGVQAAMQAMRYTVISPTNNVWMFRIWNERINRTAAQTYALLERNAFQITTPWGKQTVTTVNINDNTIGEDPAVHFKFKATRPMLPGGFFVGLGGGGTAVVGWAGTEGWTDITSVNTYNITDNAIRQIRNQEPGVATYEKIIIAPIHNIVGYIDIERRLNYPVTMYWRGGEASKSCHPEEIARLLYGDPSISLPTNYRIHSAAIARFDTQYDVDGTPTVTAKLGWKDLHLLEGTTTGRMSGKEYQNVLGQIGIYLYIDAGWESTRITREIRTVASFYPDYDDFYTWLVEADVKDEYWADYLAYGTQGYLGGPAPNPGVKYEYPANDRPANTAEYSLKSRYVIDYDHKGRFYAAIRCEVVCSGAAWKEDLAVWKGYMVKDTDPTYTVKIWFECGWGGDDAGFPTSGVSELLLAEETITRPMFEAISVSMISPWYWNTVHLDRDVKVRTPPEPVPDEDFMMVFKNLASHQGVNPNLCCADVRPDIIGADAAAVISKDGVEYSYEEDGIVTPHTKFVTGQLYARTFKLSDFYEAFWMLRQLKVNATEDNIEGTEEYPRPAWFYHPAIKAALDVTRHIEVRDGIIVQWSDNILTDPVGFPPTRPPLPAPTSRQIKLYRV